MPNWKKIITSGSDATLNSLIVTSGITGSLLGTASYATQALSSSYALTSSYSNTSTSASHAVNADNAITASYVTLAQTASYVQTAQTASYVLQAVSASYSTQALSSSYALTASYYGGSVVSASYALTASYVNPVNQTVQISGAIRLDPTQDPDPTGAVVTSTFLFQSASNTTLGQDLYFRQDGNLIKWKWVESQIGTGLLYGGALSYSGNYTSSIVMVKSGSGIIANSFATTGSEPAPILTQVSWTAQTQSLAYITSSQQTYVYIDSNGVMQQQTSFFTPTQYSQVIPLGIIYHGNKNNPTAAASNVYTVYNTANQSFDFIQAFGPLKLSGMTLTGQTGNLSINISAGSAYVLGGYYAQDPNGISHYNSTTVTTGSIARLYRSGSTGQFTSDNNGGAYYTTIDPTQYDNNGVLAPVPGGSFSIQRVFFNPITNRSGVYYGQNVYNTLADAKANLANDSFTEASLTAHNNIFTAYLIVKSGLSSLTDTSNSAVVQAGLFRNTVGSSGGISYTLTLDDLSDVTITTPSSGQALIYNGGTWINGNPTSASYATTSSYSNTSTSASYALNATNATTASYVLSAVSASFATLAQTANTASYVVTAQTASYVQTAQTASYVLQAVSASFSTTAQTASYVLQAVSASFATLAQTANTASYVVTAQTASYVLNAISASFATTASYATQALSASWAPGGSGNAFPYTGSAEITGSLGVTGSFNIQTYDGVLANTFVPAITINDISRNIYDIFGTSSIEAIGRTLSDDSAIVSINWRNRAMFDYSSAQSIDWANRFLLDSSGTTTSVDWSTRALKDSAGSEAILWDYNAQAQGVNINSYTRKYIGLTTTAETFSNFTVYGNFQPDGEILNRVTLDSSVVDFDLVFLETDGAWYPVDMTNSSTSKLLGIAWGVGTGKEKVLLEGTMVVNDSSLTDTPQVTGIAPGLPIYIRTGTGTYMSTAAPSTSGDYVRLLGHAYYQGAADPNYWVMKFRPSNNWYVI